MIRFRRLSRGYNVKPNLSAEAALSEASSESFADDDDHADKVVRLPVSDEEFAELRHLAYTASRCGDAGARLSMPDQRRMLALALHFPMLSATLTTLPLRAQLDAISGLECCQLLDGERMLRLPKFGGSAPKHVNFASCSESPGGGFDDVSEEQQQGDICGVVVSGKCALFINMGGRLSFQSDLKVGAEVATPEENVVHEGVFVEAIAQGEAEALRLPRASVRDARAREEERKAIRNSARLALLESGINDRERFHVSDISEYFQSHVQCFETMSARVMEQLCQHLRLRCLPAGSHLTNFLAGSLCVILKGQVVSTSTRVAMKEADERKPGLLYTCPGCERIFADGHLCPRCQLEPVPEVKHVPTILPDLWEDDVLGEWQLCMESGAAVAPKQDAVTFNEELWSVTDCALIVVPKAFYMAHLRPYRISEVLHQKVAWLQSAVLAEAAAAASKDTLDGVFLTQQTMAQPRGKLLPARLVKTQGDTGETSSGVRQWRALARQNTGGSSNSVFSVETPSRSQRLGTGRVGIGGSPRDVRLSCVPSRQDTGQALASPSNSRRSLASGLSRQDTGQSLAALSNSRRSVAGGLSRQDTGQSLAALSNSRRSVAGVSPRAQRSSFNGDPTNSERVRREPAFVEPKELTTRQKAAAEAIMCLLENGSNSDACLKMLWEFPETVRHHVCATARFWRACGGEVIFHSLDEAQPLLIVLKGQVVLLGNDAHRASLAMREGSPDEAIAPSSNSSRKGSKNSCLSLDRGDSSISGSPVHTEALQLLGDCLVDVAWRRKLGLRAPFAAESPTSSRGKRSFLYSRELEEELFKYTAPEEETVSDDSPCSPVSCMSMVANIESEEFIEVAGLGNVSVEVREGQALVSHRPGLMAVAVGATTELLVIERSEILSSLQTLCQGVNKVGREAAYALATRPGPERTPEDLWNLRHMLPKCRAFEGLESRTRTSICKSMQVLSFPKESGLCMQGDIAEGLFHVLDGIVEASIDAAKGAPAAEGMAGVKDHPSPRMLCTPAEEGEGFLGLRSASNETHVVAVMGAGSTFGERVLLCEEEVQAFSMTAATNLQLAWVDKNLYMDACCDRSGLRKMREVALAALRPDAANGYKLSKFHKTSGDEQGMMLDAIARILASLPTFAGLAESGAENHEQLVCVSRHCEYLSVPAGMEVTNPCSDGMGAAFYVVLAGCIGKYPRAEEMVDKLEEASDNGSDSSLDPGLLEEDLAEGPRQDLAHCRAEVEYISHCLQRDPLGVPFVDRIRLHAMQDKIRSLEAELREMGVDPDVEPADASSSASEFSSMSVGGGRRWARSEGAKVRSAGIHKNPSPDALLCESTQPPLSSQEAVFSAPDSPLQPATATWSSMRLKRAPTAMSISTNNGEHIGRSTASNTLDVADSVMKTPILSACEGELEEGDVIGGWGPGADAQATYWAHDTVELMLLSRAACEDALGNHARSRNGKHAAFLRRILPVQVTDDAIEKMQLHMSPQTRPKGCVLAKEGALNAGVWFIYRGFSKCSASLEAHRLTRFEGSETGDGDSNNGSDSGSENDGGSRVDSPAGVAGGHEQQHHSNDQRASSPAGAGVDGGSAGGSSPAAHATSAATAVQRVLRKGKTCIGIHGGSRGRIALGSLGSGHVIGLISALFGAPEPMTVAVSSQDAELFCMRMDAISKLQPHALEALKDLARAQVEWQLGRHSNAAVMSSCHKAAQQKLVEARNACVPQLVDSPFLRRQECSEDSLSKMHAVCQEHIGTVHPDAQFMFATKERKFFMEMRLSALSGTKHAPTQPLPRKAERGLVRFRAFQMLCPSNAELQDNLMESNLPPLSEGRPASSCSPTAGGDGLAGASVSASAFAFSSTGGEVAASGGEAQPAASAAGTMTVEQMLSLQGDHSAARAASQFGGDVQDNKPPIPRVELMRASSVMKDTAYFVEANERILNKQTRVLAARQMEMAKRSSGTPGAAWSKALRSRQVDTARRREVSSQKLAELAEEEVELLTKKKQSRHISAENRKTAIAEAQAVFEDLREAISTTPTTGRKFSEAVATTSTSVRTFAGTRDSVLLAPGHLRSSERANQIGRMSIGPQQGLAPARGVRGSVAAPVGGAHVEPRQLGTLIEWEQEEPTLFLGDRRRSSPPEAQKVPERPSTPVRRTSGRSPKHRHHRLALAQPLPFEVLEAVAIGSAVNSHGAGATGQLRRPAKPQVRPRQTPAPLELDVGMRGEAALQVSEVLPSPTKVRELLPAADDQRKEQCGGRSPIIPPHRPPRPQPQHFEADETLVLGPGVADQPRRGARPQAPGRLMKLLDASRPPSPRPRPIPLRGGGAYVPSGGGSVAGGGSVSEQ